MKLKYSLCALAFIANSCDTEKKPVTVSEKQVVADNTSQSSSKGGVQMNERFDTALRYVDTDGAYLTLNDVSLETDFVMDMFGSIESTLLSKSPMPKGLSVVEMVKKARLDRVVATATSVRKVEGGWKNKTFYDLGGTQDGIFKLFKGTGSEWSAYSFAPSGTDFVQEYDLNIENVRESFEYMIAGVDENAKEQLVAMFEAKVSQEQQMAMFLDGMHARVSFIAKMDDGQKITAPQGIEFPNVDIALKVDGMFKLFKQFEGQLSAVMKKESKNGYVYYTPKREVEQAPGVPTMSPALVVDEQSGTLWASLRTDFLEQCLGDGPKLKDDSEFKGLMKDMSDNGNLFMYVSHQVVQQAQELYKGKVGEEMKKQMEQNSNSPADQAVAELMMKAIDDRVFPTLLKSKGGYAYTLDLNKDGLLISSRTPIPMKNSYGNSSWMMVPALAAISSPIIIRQIARARGTTAISNAKDIYVALIEYAVNKGGKAPIAGEGASANAHLRLLFTSGVCQDEKPFFVKGVEGFRLPDENIQGAEALAAGENIWAYVPGRSLTDDPANTPLMMAPFTRSFDGTWQFDRDAFGNQLVVLRTDGSAILVDVSEDNGALYDEEGNLIYQDGKAYLTGPRQRKAFPLAMPETE